MEISLVKLLLLADFELNVRLKLTTDPAHKYDRILFMAKKSFKFSSLVKQVDNY